ncbi:hypothetical protein RFN25_31320 [Mesorhizobium abyssinicae]|uniref:Uncharacterized protein n=1 Tax=Mesorhizobium album TaxID=3072314 RepID=A0ABU4Y1K5_9HYPH|nr:MULTISPECIES: hypothetical protein [Mesorhizobium]MDX8437882.1 hypothetical protein [Mesorhizobium abyssinicae]MDX8480837.1 hypothetical protein [Mesorhizobium sp. VK24D]MDX8522814.1 hypothetical protein [Mesorhizobium sp. VK23D]
MMVAKAAAKFDGDRARLGDRYPQLYKPNSGANDAHAAVPPKRRRALRLAVVMSLKF